MKHIVLTWRLSVRKILAVFIGMVAFFGGTRPVYGNIPARMYGPPQYEAHEQIEDDYSLYESPYIETENEDPLNYETGKEQELGEENTTIDRSEENGEIKITPEPKRLEKSYLRRQQ